MSVDVFRSRRSARLYLPFPDVVPWIQFVENRSSFGDLQTHHNLNGKGKRKGKTEPHKLSGRLVREANVWIRCGVFLRNFALFFLPGVTCQSSCAHTRAILTGYVLPKHVSVLDGRDAILKTPCEPEIGRFPGNSSTKWVLSADILLLNSLIRR